MTDTTTTTATLTPYACAKIVNDTLKARGVEKVLPPQMLYTYVKKAYIPSTDNKVSLVDLQVWFEKYFAKLTNVKQDVVEEVAATMAEEGEVFAAETDEA